MDQSSAIAVLSKLSAPNLGVFRGRAAVEHGVTRRQLTALCATGVLERELPDTYRMTVVARCAEQRLRAALLWAGTAAAATGRSAGVVYGLEGLQNAKPEIAMPRDSRCRSDDVIVHRVVDPRPLMLRRYRGVLVTGVEATFVQLAHLLDGEALETACEDARRRKLTSVPAIDAYLKRFARPGQRGVTPLRELLAQLDPVHPSRSRLEVKTRRLPIANGFTDFAREFPLAWNGRTYRFDFGFERRLVILETNGRRWHDDPTDFEHDNEKSEAQNDAVAP